MSAQGFSFTAANGTVIVPIPGGAAGEIQAAIVFGSTPGAGVVTASYRRASGVIVALTKVVAASVTSGVVEFAVPEAATALVLTFSGLAAPITATLWVDASIIPAGGWAGNRALTTQSYTEGNVKNGVQYEVATLNAAFPGNGTVDYIVVTAAKPVIIKGRLIQCDGLGVTSTVYSNPSYTDGTPIPYFNLNYRNPVAGTIQILGAPTVSNPGTQRSATRVLLGGNQPGSQTAVSFTTDAVGLEYLLAPNTSYLFRTVSLDPDTQRVASYNTWFEGEPDLPL